MELTNDVKRKISVYVENFIWYSLRNPAIVEFKKFSIFNGKKIIKYGLLGNKNELSEIDKVHHIDINEKVINKTDNIINLFYKIAKELATQICNKRIYAFPLEKHMDIYKCMILYSLTIYRQEIRILVMDEIIKTGNNVLRMTITKRLSPPITTEG